MSWFNSNMILRWIDHRGILSSAPGASSWGDTRTDIFVLGTDNKIWQACREFNNPMVWVHPTPYENPKNDWAYSSPFTLAWGRDKLGILMTSAKSKIYFKYWDGKLWTPWQDLNKPNGVAFTTAPAAISKGSRLDVFAVAHDNNLWWKPNTFKNGTISKSFYQDNKPENNGWINLGHPRLSEGFIYGPNCMIINGQLNVFLNGANGWLWKKVFTWYTGPNFSDRWEAVDSSVDGFAGVGAMDGVKFINKPVLFKAEMFSIHNMGDDGKLYVADDPTGSSGVGLFRRSYLDNLIPKNSYPKEIAGTVFTVEGRSYYSLLGRGANDHLYEMIMPPRLS